MNALATTGPGALATLPQSVRAGASIAPAARRACAAALAALDRYLDGQPLTDANLVAYLIARHDVGASPATP